MSVARQRVQERTVPCVGAHKRRGGVTDVRHGLKVGKSSCAPKHGRRTKSETPQGQT